MVSGTISQASNAEHSLTFEYSGQMCGGRLDQASACSPGGNPLTVIHANGEGGFATVFEIQNGVWTDDNQRTIAQVGSQWVMTSPEGAVETYDSYGRPLTIKDERGIGLTYAYNGSGALATITHTSGRTLSFAWTNGKVGAITAPNGKVYSYTYNGAGYLASVTYPDNLGTRSYHYEDSRDASRLTGISINGVRYSRYAYQADGRVAWSGLENGVERSTFAYTDTTTAVTNALGQTAKRQGHAQFAQFALTARRAQKTSRDQNEDTHDSGLFRHMNEVFLNQNHDTCTGGKGLLCTAVKTGGTATTASFTYTPWGQIATRKDKTGTVTDTTSYAYDGMGRLTTIGYPSQPEKTRTRTIRTICLDCP